MYAKVLSVLLLASIALLAHASLKEDELEGLFEEEFDIFFQTGRKTPKLQNDLSFLQFPGAFRAGYKNQNKGLLECIVCRRALNGLLTARRLGASKDSLKQRIIDMCIVMQIESAEICEKVINMQADSIFYIVDNKPELTASRMCSIIAQSLGCKDRKRKNWKIEIPERTSLVKPLPDPSNKPPIKIVQLTDIHYDPFYTTGSNANCDGPLCCQPNTKPSKPANAAGQWGDYRGCDTSWDVLTNTLNQINYQHKDMDYFMFTGDVIDHRVWETTVDNNSATITEVYKLFDDTFSVPILPILGNHEPHPVNIFSSEDITVPKLSTQWIFDLSADLWSAWLPKETRETILKGGYYTYLLRPGLRIVALNSNVCYTFNWWLLWDDYDQYGQLRWLVEVLTEAEKNGEAVHILSHVPSGESDCFQNWGLEFTKIVIRFADTIVAQFNGHTHHDTNVIYFNSSKTGEAVNVAFNGGSLTPYKFVNPNYVLYDVDPETFEVLDYDMWIYNLTDANLSPHTTPYWYKLYSFKDAYEVANLRPTEMAEMTQRMARSRQLVEQFYRFKYRDGDTALLAGCDDKCHEDNLCYQVTTYYGDDKQCKILKDIWNKERPKE